MSFTSAVQVVIGLVAILLARIRIGRFCCHFATLKAISMAHSCCVFVLSFNELTNVAAHECKAHCHVNEIGYDEGARLFKAYEFSASCLRKKIMLSTQRHYDGILRLVMLEIAYAMYTNVGLFALHPYYLMHAFEYEMKLRINIFP